MPTAVENTVQKAANGAIDASNDFFKAMRTLDGAMNDLAKSASSMSPPDYFRSLNILKNVLKQLDQSSQMLNSGQKNRWKTFQVCEKNKSKA